MNHRQAVVMLAVAITLVAPSAASAHAGPGIPVATRYAATVTSHPASLHVRVVDGDRQLWLDVPPADTVVVLGLAGEPYLRFTGEGVAINERSPTTYLNRSQPVEPPATAGTRKPPVWRTVSHGHGYRWHEDRLHALALTVRKPRPGSIGPWTIPLVVNGRAASISGTLSYRQPPSLLWIWPLPVALACLAAVLRLRSPRIDHALITTLTLAALAAIVVSHLAQNLHGRPGLAASQLGWLAFACGFALLMGALLRQPRWRSLAALASASYALAVGLALLPVLRDGTTLTALPAAVDRLTAMTALTAAATTIAVVLTATTTREKAAR
jgi:hypothetical protein